MTGVLKREEILDISRKMPIKEEAETGVMLAHTTECLGPPEAGSGRRGWLLRQL